jgi:large subunit ribosomal protein L25
MEKIILEVTQGVYKTAKDARKAGRVPMIYYGKGVTPINFSADYQDFRRIFKKAGRSAIVTIANEDKKEFNVLIHEIQYEPISDDMMHVDLIAVDMNKPITTEIPLKFTGTSPAVKDLGGVFVQNKNKVQVECLPKDLVHEIEVDISSLVDFHTAIAVKDIKVPNGIKVLDNGSINVATVAAPRNEVEEQPVAAAVTPEAGAATPEAAAGAPAAPAAAAGKEEKKKENKK